jgi:hypothetical protein
MTKKKGPQMAHAHPAEDALISAMEALIDDAAEGVDDEELAKREREANEIVEDVRARASRRERA